MKYVPLIGVTAVLAGNASAQVVGFENFAPPGGLVNVNPTMPYHEAGFTFTPLNGSAAVFDSAAATDMPGNPTDFLGFADGNTITLTRDQGPPFNLVSVLIGRSTIAMGATDITILGHLSGGGTLSMTFPGLNAATTATLNWTGLVDVQFTGTDDSAIDDVNLVPAPGAAALFGLGWVAAFRRRRMDW